MLYHNIKILLIIVFIFMQAMTVSHAVEHADHPHQDCLICDAGIVSTEIMDIAPAPVAGDSFLVAEPFFYDNSYQPAAIKPFPARGPPPRAPPLTQV